MQQKFLIFKFLALSGTKQKDSEKKYIDTPRGVPSIRKNSFHVQYPRDSLIF